MRALFIALAATPAMAWGAGLSGSLHHFHSRGSGPHLTVPRLASLSASSDAAESGESARIAQLEAIIKNAGLQLPPKAPTYMNAGAVAHSS